MKKLFALILAVCMVLSLAACGSSTGSSSQSKNNTSSDEHENVYLTLSSPPTTSGLFTLYASMPDALSKEYPWIHITVVEGTGANGANQQVCEGAAQIGASSPVANYNTYHGLDIFEGNADENIRTFICVQISPIVYGVAKDAGINGFSDLAGKKSCPGSTGTTTTTVFSELAERLGMECDWRPASQSDALDSYGNREIDGMGKSCGGYYDSMIVQMNASRETDIISLTDEELEIIYEMLPYASECIIPAGTYDFIDHDVRTFCWYATACASAVSMTQQTGYEIIKGLNEGEGREYMLAAVPALADEDWCENLIAGAAVPLHAGAVQYLVEKGYEVPAELIPPEYVPVA